MPAAVPDPLRKAPARSRVFLDCAASAPLDPAVAETVRRVSARHDANPSSVHRPGLRAMREVEVARIRVAARLGADPDALVFTSGGTEANNLALKGMVWAAPRSRRHLLVSTIEHPCVLEAAEWLHETGQAELEMIPVDGRGRVQPEALAARLRPDTLLVSVMHANNEIGTIQPIAQIAQICSKHGALLHTDASQSLGKTKVDVEQLGVDFLTVAGHKVYAPKGVGALYIRRGLELHPLIEGVGHELGLRAGTENVPYRVALGKALELAKLKGPELWAQMGAQRDRLFELLRDGIGPELTQNGAAVPRLPNTLSVNFPGARGVDVLAGAPEVCASTSAACHSGQFTPTATQSAIGLTPERAAGTVRLSLGWHTTEREIEDAARMLIASWKRCSGQSG